MSYSRTSPALARHPATPGVLRVVVEGDGVAGAARAQTVDIPGAPGTISREDASGKSVSKRDQANYPDAINYTDCKKDVRLRIPLLLGGFDTSVSPFL